MNVIEKYSSLMKDKVSLPRYEHIMRVLETALAINKAYNINEDKLATSALLHDYAKELPECERKAIAEDNGCDSDHAYVGAVLAKKELGINDEDILQGIACHTHGLPNMCTLAKIIYIADRTEPSRKYENPQRMEHIKELATNGDIDRAVFLQVKENLRFYNKNGIPLHKNTIELYESIKDENENVMESSFSLLLF